MPHTYLIHRGRDSLGYIYLEVQLHLWQSILVTTYLKVFKSSYVLHDFIYTHY